MNQVLVIAATLLVGKNATMAENVNRLLNAQATLPPAEFEQKARKLPTLARAALIAYIGYLTDATPENTPERDELEKLAAVLG